MVLANSTGDTFVSTVKLLQRNLTPFIYMVLASPSGVTRHAMCCISAEEVREQGRKGCLTNVKIFALCCVWTEEVRERREERAA
jgi:hypothetical protein